MKVFHLHDVPSEGAPTLAEDSLLRMKCLSLLGICVTTCKASLKLLTNCGLKGSNLTRAGSPGGGRTRVDTSSRQRETPDPSLWLRDLGGGGGGGGGGYLRPRIGSACRARPGRCCGVEVPATP